MKPKLLLPLCLIVSALSLVSCKSHKTGPPQLSQQPLGSDNLAIYRSFSSPQKSTVSPPQPVPEEFRQYIFDQTVPFHLQPEDQASRPSCLKDFPASAFEGNIVHQISADVFPPPDILVKPGTDKVGEYGKSVNHASKRGPCETTFSEIVFNPSHTRAAFWFVHTCYMYGGPQSMGSTVTFDKQNGVWKSGKSCRNWMS